MIHKPDFNSPTWKWVEDRMNELLSRDRQKIEGKLDVYDTAHVRGRIEAFREFLKEVDKLANPRKPGT